MWAWVITMRRSTGSNKVIASTTALISDLSASTRCLLHCTAIHVSKRSLRRLFRRGNLEKPLLKNERRERTTQVGRHHVHRHGGLQRAGPARFVIPYGERTKNETAPGNCARPFHRHRRILKAEHR